MRDKYKLVNLTPHTVTIIPNNGASLKFESQGNARLIQTVTSERLVSVGSEDTVISVLDQVFGQVTGLPNFDPTSETLYIVSSLVARMCPGRNDLVVPANLVRDDFGNVIGARCLAREPEYATA